MRLSEPKTFQSHLFLGEYSLLPMRIRLRAKSGSFMCIIVILACSPLFILPITQSDQLFNCPFTALFNISQSNLTFSHSSIVYYHQTRQKIPNSKRIIIKFIQQKSIESTTMSQKDRKNSKKKFSSFKDKMVDGSHHDNFIFNKTPILASALKKLKSKAHTSSSVSKPIKRSEPIDIDEQKINKKVKKDQSQYMPALSYTPLQRDLFNFFAINKSALRNFEAVPEPKFQVGSTVMSALCDRGIGGKFLVSNIFRNKKCYIDYKAVSLFTNEKKNQEVLQKYDSAGEFVIGTVVKGMNPHHVQLELSSFLTIDQKNIKIGQSFPAQIKSKEQLGCLLLVSGIKSYKIFLPKASVGDGFDELIEDKQVIVVVKQVDQKKKLIKVTLTADEQLAMNFKGLQQQDLAKIQLDQFVAPGTLVNTKILKVLTNGLMVKFLKIFVGFIHIDHLNKPLESYTVNDKLLARIIFYCINPPTLYLSQKHVNLQPFAPKHQLYTDIPKPHHLQQRQNSFFSREGELFVHSTQLVDGSFTGIKKLYVKENNYFERYQIMSTKKIGIAVGDVDKVVPFSNFKIYGEKQGKQGHRFRVMCLDQWNKVIKISYDQKILKAPKDSLLFDVDTVNQSKKYMGFVSNVNPNGVVVEFCNNIKGILSKNQLKLAEIDITQANIGQSLQAYVCKIKKGYIGLTLKAPQLRSTKLTKPSQIKAQQSANGESVQMGVIQSVNKKSIYPIYIKLKSNKFAKISIFDGIRAPSFNDAHIIENLEEHFKVGQNVRVFRKGKNYFLYPPEQMKDKELRYCRILGVKGSHLRVQTGDNEFKNCHITNITDIITPYPLSEFKVGEYTIGRVISDQQICLRVSVVQHGVPKSMQQCITRYNEAEKQGDLRNRLLTIGSSSLKVDMVCFGYIKTCQQNGCFVSLSHNYEVRVQRSELSDIHIKDKEKEFKTNKLVLCRLISSKVKNNQPNQVMFDASLRESVVKFGYPLNDEILEHGVGLTVEGTIKGYVKGKALVQLHSSKFTGIISLKDVEGVTDESLQKALPIGKYLKFKIVQYSLQGQKRLIRLCTLQKVFTKYQAFDTNFQADQRVVKLWQNFKQLQAFKAPQQQNELVDIKKLEQHEKDQEERIMNMLAMGEMEEEEAEEKSQEENRQVEEEKEQMDQEDQEEEMEDQEEDSQDEDQGAHDNSSQKMDEQKGKNQQQKPQSTKANKQQHQQFRQRTQMFQKMPHTPSFYHSLVLANPTPQSWLLYISSLLNTSTPQQIRIQFMKAIQSFSEIKDKDNMWISWINMELVLGDVMGTVKKAIENNVGPMVYFRVLEILVEQQQWDVAIEFARKMLKKFNRDIKAYIEFLKMVYKYESANNKKINESITQKQILRRASQCLKSHEITTIESHIAKHLFQTKEYQKGRNVFEQLISKHPKRTDLWSMYIDMEIKGQQIDKARNLLQRILALNMNKKKTKSILKKYYLLEQQYGTEKSAQGILNRAQVLAEEFQNKNGDNQDEDQDDQ